MGILSFVVIVVSYFDQQGTYTYYVHVHIVLELYLVILSRDHSYYE